MKHKIVLVPFPFDDFTTLKMRPALCLSDPVGKYDHIILAFISSKVPQDILETDIVLKSGSADFEGTGLRVDSVIRIHKMVTVPVSLIKRQLGIINEVVQSEVATRLNKIFNG